jgi:hypothetical protein
MKALILVLLLAGCCSIVTVDATIDKQTEITKEVTK